MASAAMLADATRIVYVSPLKALSNDVRINLEAPLLGIRDKLLELRLPDVEIRTQRAYRRYAAGRAQCDAAACRRISWSRRLSRCISCSAPTPDARCSRRRARVIVDEIHALAPNKRGAHLALSLERLQSLCGRPLTRIGLSATQKPIDEVAGFLLGARPAEQCEIIDSRLHAPARSGHRTSREHRSCGDVGGRLAADLCAPRATDSGPSHHVDLRQHAAHGRARGATSVRIARQGGSRPRITAAWRANSASTAEQRLKRGELRALVATASLELGIDIGDVDLVCQIASPRSIATFLQRVGRANHAVDGLPKARLFPTSRDDLVECAALLDAVRRGELDALHVDRNALDVLAQQIVAEVACREWNEGELFDLVTRAYPFVDLSRNTFNNIVRMLADGYQHTARTARGVSASRCRQRHVARAPRRAFDCDHLGRRDSRHGRLRSDAGAAGTAWLARCNEDFAVESIAGDIFQLGNTAYRILRVERGRVRVEDAQGMPPTIPFWLGEAPGRSDELSFAVSRLREELSGKAANDGANAATRLAVRASSASATPQRSKSSITSAVPRPRSACCRRRTRTGDGTLLRRIRRHAAHHPLAVRQSHQSRLGTGAAQALLPQVQFRVAGCGDRGRDHAVAVDQPQLPTRRSRALSAFERACATC